MDNFQLSSCTATGDLVEARCSISEPHAGVIHLCYAVIHKTAKAESTCLEDNQTTFMLGLSQKYGFTLWP